MAAARPAWPCAEASRTASEATRAPSPARPTSARAAARASRALGSLRQDRPPVAVGLGVVRPQGDRPVEARQGLLEAPVPEEQVAGVGVRLGIAGPGGEGG